MQRATAAHKAAQVDIEQTSSNREDRDTISSLERAGNGPRPGARRAATEGGGFSPRKESIGLASATNLWPAGICE